MDSLAYRTDRETEEELERLQTAVLRGDVEDWADYRYHCGQIRGIQFAMRVAKEMREQAAQEDFA